MDKSPVRLTVGILALCAVVFIVWQGIDALVANKSEHMVLAVDVKIAEQKLQLVQIADLTRQNGADAITERIIVDCSAPDRQRFDVLLDALAGTITPPELSELEDLFYKCGRFFADRRAVMASRLVREVSIYHAYASLRETLLKRDDDLIAQLETWKQLADAELETAEYFNELVTLQGKIIAELRSGKSRNSVELTDTLAEVQNIRVKMSILGKQIENYRTAVVKV